jgi:hypothetical protein
MRSAQEIIEKRLNPLGSKDLHGSATCVTFCVGYNSSHLILRLTICASWHSCIAPA